MSLIGKKIEEFDVPAYYDGDIIRVSNKDLEGKWSVFFFYPEILHSYVQLNWKIWH